MQFETTAELAKQWILTTETCFHLDCLGYVSADLKNSPTSGVNHTESFVLAGGADHTALSVPAHTVDQIWMSITQLVHQLTRANVPHTQDVITAWSKHMGIRIRHTAFGKLTLDRFWQSKAFFGCF